MKCDVADCSFHGADEHTVTVILSEGETPMTMCKNCFEEHKPIVEEV